MLVGAVLSRWNVDTTGGAALTATPASSIEPSITHGQIAIRIEVAGGGHALRLGLGTHKAAISVGDRSQGGVARTTCAGCSGSPPLVVRATRAVRGSSDTIRFNSEEAGKQPVAVSALV